MYFESVTSYMLSALVLLLGGCLCVFVGRQLSIKTGLTLAIYSWHSLFGLAYYAFILSNGGDALAYYQRAKFEYISLVYGTEFVVWLTSFPVELGFSFLSTNLLYNLIGAIGLLFFHVSLRDAAVPAVENWFSKALVTACTFLPSVSFWSSGIGKDSIAFLAVALFVWSAIALQRRVLLIIAAVVLMLAVRPHIAALMIASIVLGTLFIRKLHGALRMTFGLAAFVAAFFAVPTALVYVGTDQFVDLESYVEDRQGKNIEGGSSVDITAMNPVLRLPSYIYRPLPHEASGAAQLASGLENLFLILLTVIAMVAIFRAGIIQILTHYAIHIVYGVVGLVILSQVTANLGLAARQKWMMLPPLMIVTVGAWSIARERGAASRRKLLGRMVSLPDVR